MMLFDFYICKNGDEIKKKKSIKTHRPNYKI